MPRSLPATVLALDLGTSSTRAAVYDARGRQVAGTLAQFTYPLQTDAEGRAELRPADLERAVTRAIAQALQAYGTARPAIMAVGVSCFWHSMLGLDAQGKPLTPIYTWADSRPREEARRLRRNGGETAIHARTGCMARASFWPARLLWLRRNDPALFARVARWVSPGEWMQQRMCGAASVSLSMASGTGLLDGRTLQWDAALLRRSGLATARLNPLSEAPLPLSAKMRARHPILAEAAWYPAIGDGAASNLGSGATAPGVAAINAGTSAALRVVVAAEKTASQKPLAPMGLFAYRIDGRRRLVGGATSNAGNLRAWALRELALPAPAALEKQLAARSGPAEGLTLLPFWMADRSPTWPEETPSAILGITQATTALDLLQALEESGYQRLAQIAARVEAAAERRLAYVVSGGITHSPASLQRLADVLGRPVHVSAEHEASLRGAAVFALERLGFAPPPPRRGRAIVPRSTPARAYAAARQRQAALEELLQKWPSGRQGAKLSR